MIIRALRSCAGIAATVAIIVYLVATACTPDYARTDAGADPDISACCRCLLLPTCGVQSCFEDAVKDIDNGARCHWLTCADGLFTYHAGACR